jgi:hypothetical protein
VGAQHHKGLQAAGTTLLLLLLYSNKHLTKRQTVKMPQQQQRQSLLFRMAESAKSGASRLCPYQQW